MKWIIIQIALILSFNVKAQDSILLKPVSIISVRADSKTPVTQKTLTSKDITNSYHGQEMVYILSNTPSITYQSDGGQPNGYVTFRIRGIDQTRINMTLNSVPLNELEDEGVYFSNYPDFALNIKSLQIQRGVGVSSNGVSSYGGSINFESKSGLEKERNLQLSYGSFNTSRVNFSNATGLINKKFSLYTNVSAYNTDGYKYHSNGSGYSAFVSGGYYNGNDIIKFTGFTGRSLNGMAWLAVSEKDIANDPRTNNNPQGEDDNFSQSFAQLQYIKFLTKDTYITTTGFYNRLDGRWGMFIDDTNLLQYGLHSNFYGVNSNLHLEKNNFTLNFSVNLNGYNRQHTGKIPDQSSDFLYDNTGYKKDFSNSLKLNYKLGKFNLYGDIQQRYVTFKYKGDADVTPLSWYFINPKTGVSYDYNEHVNYYASVGQSHREPTRTDLFGGNDNLTAPINDIKPEMVIDYETGVNITYKRIKVQANLYYMDFHNEITLLGALGSNGLPLMTSVNKSYRSGVETDVKWAVLKNITLVNNTNLSRNYINSTYKPLYTPNLIINQGIEFTKNNLMVGVSAKYQSKSYISLDNNYDAPEFVVVNASVNYKIKNYTFLLQLNNLTNKRYFTNGYVVDSERYFFVNAPFSSYLTVKYEFN